MFYGRRRRTPAKKGAKRPYRRAAKRTTKSSAKYIASICKKVISRKAENKVWFDYGANNSITQAVTTVPTYRNLLPLLNQGVGHSQRIGNEVTVKSAMIHGHVNILPYNATTNPNAVPLYVKMFLVSCKEINGNLLGATPIASDFFDVVNSSVGFQGNMLDVELTINKDVWTLYASKTLKIGSGAYGTVSGGVGYYDNSPMSIPFKFAYGKHIKKLKYDDTINIATNRNLFLIFQAVNADGTSGAYTYSPAEYHYATRVEYEDM